MDRLGDEAGQQEFYQRQAHGDEKRKVVAVRQQDAGELRADKLAGGGGRGGDQKEGGSVG